MGRVAAIAGAIVGVVLIVVLVVLLMLSSQRRQADQAEMVRLQQQAERERTDAAKREDDARRDREALEKRLATIETEAKERRRDNGPTRAAGAFRILDSTSDTACGGLLDYCLRVGCQIQNVSDAVATGGIGATYSHFGAEEVAHAKQVTLQPGAKQVVWFEFAEAGQGDRNPELRCILPGEP